MKNEKKFGRKLKLNKETIGRLDQNDAMNVAGGRTATCNTKFDTCDTDCGLPCLCLYPQTEV